MISYASSEIFKLFFSFFQVGLFSFGGGYAAVPLIQNQIVELHHLLTLEEFSDLVTIAEMTPGPIAINSATFVGFRVAGLPGAVLCTLGCVIPSFAISLLLAYIYYKYRNLKSVQTVLAMMRPVVVALIASAGTSILLLALFRSGKENLLISNFHVVEFILFSGSLFLLRKFKVSAISIILGTGIVGTVIYLAMSFLAVTASA